MRLVGLDHVVLYAADINRTVEFYTSVLGMTHVVFDGEYHALHFGDQKINLHDAERPFPPHAERPCAGAFDVCLRTDTPMSEVITHLHAHGVVIVEGPCPQTGALGPMESVYINDLDGTCLRSPSTPPPLSVETRLRTANPRALG